MSAVWVLALVLAGAPRVRATEDAQVDASAVANGLQARVGDAAEPWTVTLEAAPGGVRFRATAPGRGPLEQTVEVPPGSSTERAIVVASAVAFAIEQAPASPERAGENRGTREAPQPAAPWMVTLGGQVALAIRPPLDPSGGVELTGGRWLGVERMFRLSLSLGWAHARRRMLSVHAVQPAIQLDAGAAVGKRWWIGGGARLGVTTAWALEQGRARGSALYGRIPATVEVQLGGRFFARGTLGVELHTPSLRFRGASDRLRWGGVRPVAGLAFGANLP